MLVHSCYYQEWAESPNAYNVQDAHPRARVCVTLAQEVNRAVSGAQEAGAGRKSCY